MEDERPAEKDTSPPWPVLLPPDPEVNDIDPEFPEVEYPVDIKRSPDKPEEPASAVCNESAPELESSLPPLIIFMLPPSPDKLVPADNKLLPPASFPLPEVINNFPP
jgi:hypothetical protein